VLLSRFELARPRALEEALALLAERGDDAAPWAGGTELLLAMKLRMLRYRCLVDLKGIPGLAEVAVRNGHLDVGALVTHRRLERDPRVRALLPALAELSRHVGNARVRATGTLGGNLCFAEPHADPPALLAALGARCALAGPAGAREVALDDFIAGAYETSRADDEILTAVLVPLPPAGRRVAYERFAHLERPTIGVAAVLDVADGVVADARIVVGAVGPRPWRAAGAEARLRGARLAEAGDAIGAACASAAGGAVVDADLHGSEDYKRHLVAVLLRRALRTALSEEAAAAPPADRAVESAAGPGAGTPAPRPPAAGPVASCEVAATVNGGAVRLTVEPRELLVDVLRDRLGLRGVKRSCDVQVCGACTVLVDGAPVSSCTTLAVAVDGRDVLTIEGLAGAGSGLAGAGSGLAGAGLDPVQQAFVDHGALQCGFCTPGMILAVKALLREIPRPSDAESRHYLRGNLCRCTGYVKILEAVRSLAGGPTEAP
jgi:carbon-monoxide dehydrogenase medium subunit